jgi:hypothetical protein
MTKRAYCRCNSGHYFVGEYCPFDGWSSPASKELTDAVKTLAGLGRDVSVAELRAIGVSDSTVWRTLIVEFGTGASAFDALAPEQYVVNGEVKPPLKLGPSFK